MVALVVSSAPYGPGIPDFHMASSAHSTTTGQDFYYVIDHQRHICMSMSTKRYELLLILSGKLQDAEVASATDAIKKLFEKHGAKVVEENIWGRMKLAYEIKREKSGIYALWQLELEPNKTADLNADLQVADHVIRFLLASAPKHGKTVESPIDVAAKEEAERKELDDASKEAKEAAGKKSAAKPAKTQEEEKDQDDKKPKDLKKILEEKL